MAILSKRCKPNNFEPHNSLKLSFTNILDLRSNFVRSESFLETNSPNILSLCETNLVDSIFSGNFSVTGYLPLIGKDSDSYAWSSSLSDRRNSFFTGLISRKLCGFLLMFSTTFTSFSVLLLFSLSITSVVIQDFLFYFI